MRSRSPSPSTVSAGGRSIEARKTLADFLREDCALTGTHLGCEHGVCGACTVLVDGEAVRSCLLFAVQARRLRGHDHRRAHAARGPERHPGGVPPEPRPAVRVLHARVSSCRSTRSSRPTRRRARPRSAKGSRATSAAAPATRGSSRRSSRSCPARRRAHDDDRHRHRASRRGALHRPVDQAQGRPSPAERARHLRRRRHHDRARCTRRSCAAPWRAPTSRASTSKPRARSTVCTRSSPPTTSAASGTRCGPRSRARTARNRRRAASPTATCASSVTRSRS